MTRRSTSDRRLLLVAGAFSSFAAQTSIVTLPLVAVVGLHADPAQVGILSALGTMPFVALGLPVGAWVDRLDHRRILLAAEVIRTLLLATVPLAYWLHHLCLGHLFVVAALAGCATVFFDVATQSAIPRVVTPHALVRTNTDLNTIWGVSNVAGRGLAGLVVAAISAPWTMSVAAVSTSARSSPCDACHPASRWHLPTDPHDRTSSARSPRDYATCSAIASCGPWPGPPPRPTSARRSSPRCCRS